MIKIDMEIPNSCYTCEWWNYLTYDMAICRIDNHSMSIDPLKDDTKRCNFCPLIDENKQVCCNCNHSEKDYDYDGSFYCYYWDYEQGMSPNRVVGDDFCSNWKKIGK